MDSNQQTPAYEAGVDTKNFYYTARETWWNFAISTPTYQNSDITVVLITPHVSKANARN